MLAVVLVFFRFLDQEILLHITKRIVEEACNYAGSMMIYSIVSWVQSNVSRIVRNYEQDAKRLKIQELKQAAVRVVLMRKQRPCAQIVI
jgi:hypothetical protein